MIDSLRRTVHKIRVLWKYFPNYKEYRKTISSLQEKELKSIFIQGGLGDFILATPFVYALSEKVSGRIQVCFRDDTGIPNIESFSYGVTRKYTNASGGASNPIKEWVDVIYPNVESRGVDPKSLDVDLSIYPPELIAFNGYFPVKDLREKYILPFLPDISADTAAYDVWNKLRGYRTSQVPIVAIHLRRNAEKVLQMAREIENCLDNCVFVVLGSSEHQCIPKFSCLNNTISLIDSYSLGINTVELLSLTKNVDLFVGGRGGFELFHWAVGVPTVNFFDSQGLLEVDSYLWPKSLWLENPIPKLFTTDSSIDEVIPFVENILYKVE